MVIKGAEKILEEVSQLVRAKMRNQNPAVNEALSDLLREIEEISIEG